MKLEFRKTIDEDIDILLKIQSQVFQDDLIKYEDFDTNPACETFEKLQDNIRKYQHYTILDSEIKGIIGAIDFRGDNERMHISKLFVHEEYQNKGIGTSSMLFIENQFPNVKLWTLYTPHLSFRNHHFYEKFGYLKVKEVQLTPKLKLFKYQKTISIA